MAVGDYEKGAGCRKIVRLGPNGETLDNVEYGIAFGSCRNQLLAYNIDAEMITEKALIPSLDSFVSQGTYSAAQAEALAELIEAAKVKLSICFNKKFFCGARNE